MISFVKWHSSDHFKHIFKARKNSTKVRHETSRQWSNLRVWFIHSIFGVFTWLTFNLKSVHKSKKIQVAALSFNPSADWILNYTRSDCRIKSQNTRGSESVIVLGCRLLRSCVIYFILILYGAENEYDLAEFGATWLKEIGLMAIFGW